MNTPEQFALAALVAAGHVSQTTADKALALNPDAALTQGAGEAVEPVAYVDPSALDWLVCPDRGKLAHVKTSLHKSAGEEATAGIFTAQQVEQAVARAREEARDECIAAIRAKGTHD